MIILCIEQVVKLRVDIEDVAKNEPYMGEKRPLQWLLFEHSVSKAIRNGSKYMTLAKVCVIVGIFCSP